MAVLRPLIYLILAGGALVTAAGYLGRYFWLFDLTAHFRIQYVIGFGLLAVLLLSIRWPSAALACLLLMLANAVDVVPLYWPAPSSAAAAAPHRYRLVAFNMFMGNRQYDAVLDMLRRENADFVLLAEVEPNWADKLDSLAPLYPFRKVYAPGKGFGLALLAKEAPLKSAMLTLGEAGLPTLTATFATAAGRPLTVVATHPQWPMGPTLSRLRDDQIEAVGKHVATLPGSVILAGDLNATPFSYIFKRLIAVSGLADSSRGRGVFMTWPPLPWPLRLPIDQCLASSDVTILDKRVGPAAGSDHFPLIVDFSL